MHGTLVYMSYGLRALRLPKQLTNFVRFASLESDISNADFVSIMYSATYRLTVVSDAAVNK